MGQSLRVYLDERLTAGEYPRGSWLPSVRELSALLSVNRNTVSKVYQSLARDGLVRRVPGRGMSVVATRPRSRAGSVDDLQDDLERLVRRAHAAGLPTARVQEMVRSAAAAIRGEAGVRVALAECNREAAESLAEKLSAAVHTRVDHLLLTDVRGLRAPQRPDILVTTFFHLNELAALDTSARVVGVRHEMSYGTLTAISQLAPQTSLVVVCPNQRTLDRVEAAVRSHTPSRVLPMLADRREDLEVALKEADTAIVAWGTREVVERLRPDLPLIVVEYEIDPQSVAEVRRAISMVARGAASPTRRPRRRAPARRHVARTRTRTGGELRSR